MSHTDGQLLIPDDPNSLLTQSQNNDIISEEKSKKKCCPSCNLSSIVLLVALSVHAVFEGIALGLTKEVSSTVNIMMGLLIHKSPEAMSLGISLSKNFKNPEEKKNALRLLILFAFAAPIGVAFGMAL